MQPLHIDRPIVSFTFDDCPLSVMANGLRPLEKQGWRGTVYVAMGLCGSTNHLGLHMSEDDVKAVYESGHEIGDHSFSHIDGSQIPLEIFLSDIERNQQALADLGIPPSQTFAYPYGEATPALKQALEPLFKGARSIRSQLHRDRVDLNQIGSNRLYSGPDFTRLIRDINSLSAKPAWLCIFTHDIRDNPSPYGCTPAEMAMVIKAVKHSGADVLPVNDVLARMESYS